MAASAVALGACSHLSIGQNKLQGRAVLPASTTAAGPISGKYIAPGVTAGQTAPFAAQPVQGISALIDNKDGSFMALPDNGYGSIETSADFYLRLYRIKPAFKTAAGGAGTIEVQSFIEFNDKNNKIPFAIVNHFTADRKLTGADFDVESVQRAADSTYWVGDEFGPFLLHFDKTGTLLEAPIELPDFSKPGQYVRSPQSPFNEEMSAVRLMNAYRTHAQLHGNTKAPVFSPDFTLVDDADTNTATANRKTPPAGFAKASSELFNVSLLKSAGYPVVAWTVNDSASMVKLMRLGVSGIISDDPSLLWRLASSFDGTDANTTPDFLDSLGLLDIKKFDAQGHRGGRNLRPENTLPAMEAALDFYMTTLELDNGITKDGIPVLAHDPYISSFNARKRDGGVYTESNEVLIKNLTLAEIQGQFISDKLRTGRTLQTNDTTLSPVAVAFAASKGLPGVYVMPSLENVFDFVQFYVTYYTSGAGSNHPNALKRRANAARVRFNVETKMNPRTDKDNYGNVFLERTVGADEFATKVAEVIVAKGMTDRADIQSFAHQTLLKVQTSFPQIRTVYLFTDGPRYGTTNEGTNLQPQGADNKSPWLGGLYWPYRSTKVSNPFRAQRSGGFEGMALNIQKDKLWPLLELPLTGDDNKTIWLHEFDIATKTYSGTRLKYKYTGGTNIGDFCLFNETNGLIIERDNNQGPPSAVKRIYKVTINNSDTLTKTLVADLLNIEDDNNLSAGLGTLPQDYGVGTTYKFPYQTIESVVVVDSATLITINDNNFPFSVGRHVGDVSTAADDITDDNEMITIKLDLAHQLGHVVVTALEENNETNLLRTAIANYPNPFSNSTTLSISLGQAGPVSIQVVNVLGEMVENIELGNLGTGTHAVSLPNPENMKTGIYTLKMKVNGKDYFTKAIKAN